MPHRRSIAAKFGLSANRVQVVGKKEAMGFWSQNHFTLIPRLLE